MPEILSEIHDRRATRGNSSGEHFLGSRGGWEHFSGNISERNRAPLSRAMAEGVKGYSGRIHSRLGTISITWYCIPKIRYTELIGWEYGGYEFMRMSRD